jgi:tRNA(adenine34) deaminase
MQRGLELAQKAEAAGEVPVGAVMVYNGECIGEGYNCPIKTCDPTSHAEINALREAGVQLKNYRLTGSTLYVTLEPCAMCVTAMIHARVSRLVFATPDPKTGAVISAISLLNANYHNHHIQVEQSLLAEEASLMLKNFFQKRRKV